MNKTIRILFFGHFGPPFLTAARSFQRRRIQVDLLRIGDSAKVPSSAIRFCRPFPKAMVGTGHGLELILKHVEDLRPDALLALSEAHLLWLSRESRRFPSHCKLLIPPADVLARLFSKQDQLQLAVNCGFSLLPTWKLNSPQGMESIPEEAFPICLRPSDPTTVLPTFKVRYVDSREAGTQFLAGCTIEKDPVLAQPFRALPNMLVHGARSESGEILALEPFFVGRKFEGVTLAIERMSPLQPVLESCARFVNAAGVVGPFHFCLLYSVQENRVFYLEINTRLGGTTDKIYRLGFDFPGLCLRCFGFDVTGEDMNRFVKGIAVNRRQLVKHFLAAMVGSLTPIDYPMVSRWRHMMLTARDFMFARDSVFSVEDLRGTCAYYLRTPRS